MLVRQEKAKMSDLHNIKLSFLRTLAGDLQQSSDLSLIQSLGVPLALNNLANLRESLLISMHIHISIPLRLREPECTLPPLANILVSAGFRLVDMAIGYVE